MSKPRMTYFETEDALHMVIAEGPEAASGGGREFRTPCG